MALEVTRTMSATMEALGGRDMDMDRRLLYTASGGSGGLLIMTAYETDTNLGKFISKQNRENIECKID